MKASPLLSAWSLQPRGGEGTVTFSANILHNYTCSNLTLSFQSLGHPRAAGRDPSQSQLGREFLLLSVVLACLRRHCLSFLFPYSATLSRPNVTCTSVPQILIALADLWWKGCASLESDFKGLEVSFPGFCTLGISSGLCYSREPNEAHWGTDRWVRNPVGFLEQVALGTSAPVTIWSQLYKKSQMTAI